MKTFKPDPFNLVVLRREAKYIAYWLNEVEELKEELKQADAQNIRMSNQQAELEVEYMAMRYALSKILERFENPYPIMTAEREEMRSMIEQILDDSDEDDPDYELH